MWFATYLNQSHEWNKKKNTVYHEFLLLDIGLALPKEADYL